MDRELLRIGLDRIACVIDGAARGADTAGHMAARGRGLNTGRFHADWEKYGRAAGPVRNTEMLKFLIRRREQGQEPRVLAFHENMAESRGTANMVKQAQRAGIRVDVFPS